MYGEKSSHSFTFPLSIVLSFLLFGSIVMNVWFGVQLYHGAKVVSVFDGDSFELENGTRVRLLGVDAPEKGRCMADESKIALASLIVGKHVRIRHGVVDSYGRLIGTVYVIRFPFKDINAGEFLAEMGLVKNNSVASQRAKSNKLGIYSDQCIGEAYKVGCDIKGNIRQGKKQYYTPSCRVYDQVIVDQSFGDEWFCAAEDALDSGYELARSCR